MRLSHYCLGLLGKYYVGWGGGGGVPQSDFRGSQKSRVISGEMSKYDRKCRGKHQRSERTDGTSGETNKHRNFSLCEANIDRYSIPCTKSIGEVPEIGRAAGRERV